MLNFVSLYWLFSSPLPIHIAPNIAHLHPYPDIILSDLWELNSPPVNTSPVSAPQALYKLYNVAANHRHLYHHAFPGHQVDEVAEEQDKKRD